jgi:hypothetical protein
MLTPNNTLKIILDDKEYELEKIYISELNYLMIRLFNPLKKIYITYNLGDYDPVNNFIKDEIEKIGRDRAFK